ncbi:MAG: hypothetical protein C0424_07590, partial [Sphingobacteriaceae bacterium]|nr:hypothetical protein [Sphingobacteriaceae bacterium]
SNIGGAEGFFAVHHAVSQELQPQLFKRLFLSVRRTTFAGAEGTEPFGQRCWSSLSGVRRDLLINHALGLKLTMQYLAAPHPHYLRELRGKKSPVAAGNLSITNSLTHNIAA